jgi:cholinesterase
MRLTVIFVSIGLVQADDLFSVGQAVKTGSGVVTGRASPWHNNVSEYLGIPFAKPPIGQLRWAPPVVMNDSSSKTIEATKLGFSCLQASPFGSFGDIDSTMLGEARAHNDMDEDCLTLNIWTKPQTGDSKKAVMIWIYGGAFSMGSASLEGYNGALLADQHDVVVVGVNYRLGVLGYPGVSIPEKNPGLLDQRAAVEWLRDNVEAFGGTLVILILNIPLQRNSNTPIHNSGDPKRMILFGQSAGKLLFIFHIA